MDYISFPEKVIYCERERLEDFDVKNKKSLNFILESELHKLYYIRPGYKSFALNIMNTAYYICTMVKADDDPSRNFGDYLDIIEKRMQRSEDGVALVLSMVLIIIDAYKWNETKSDLGTFALQGFYEIEKNNHIRYAYYEQAKNHYESRADRTTLSPDSEFMRRPINYRLLAENYSVEDLRELFGTDEDKVFDFIFTLGKDEEEQYTIASFLEDQMHSFFADGWRRKAFFDYIKSGIHKKFHGEEESAEMDAQIEEDLMKEYEQQWELDYYKDEYQKQKAEIATLHAEIERIEEAVKDVDDRHSITQEQLHEIFPGWDVTTKEVTDFKEKTAESPQTPETEVLQAKILELKTNLTRQEEQLVEANNINAQQATCIKELQADVERLKSELDKAKKKSSMQDEWYTGEYRKLPEDVEFVLRERVVFFATVLSLDLDKKYTVLSNLATFISELCNDQKNVGPFLSRMKKPDEAEKNAKAAKKVAGLMKNILPDEYQNDKHLRINQLIVSMLLNFPSEEE